jgi:hypothetical protein
VSTAAVRAAAACELATHAAEMRKIAASETRVAASRATAAREAAALAAAALEAAAREARAHTATSPAAVRASAVCPAATLRPAFTSTGCAAAYSFRRRGRTGRCEEF